MFWLIGFFLLIFILSSGNTLNGFFAKNVILYFYMIVSKPTALKTKYIFGDSRVYIMES